MGLEVQFETKGNLRLKLNQGLAIQPDNLIDSRQERYRHRSEFIFSSIFCICKIKCISCYTKFLFVLKWAWNFITLKMIYKEDLVTKHSARIRWLYRLRKGNTLPLTEATTYKVNDCEAKRTKYEPLFFTLINSKFGVVSIYIISI